MFVTVALGHGELGEWVDKCGSDMLPDVVVTVWYSIAVSA